MVKIRAGAAGSGRAGSDGRIGPDSVDRECAIRSIAINQQPEPKTGAVSGYSRRTFNRAAPSGAICSCGQATPSTERRGD